MFKTAMATAVRGVLLSLSVFTFAQNEIPPCSDSPDAPRTPTPENMVRPRYPKDALRSGKSGEVTLRVAVEPNGRLKDLTVLSGDREFSESAAAAIHKWHFQTMLDQGRPVETIYRVRVRFSSLLREANSDVELESPRPVAMQPSLPLSIKEQRLGEAVHRTSEPGMVAPKAIYQPEPEFSEASRKEKHQGNVNIAMVVGSDGLPRDLTLICSSIPESNQNAIDAVKQWRFAPGTKDGKPVDVAIVVEVSFHLYNQPGMP